MNISTCFFCLSRYIAKLSQWLAYMGYRCDGKDPMPEQYDVVIKDYSCNGFFDVNDEIPLPPLKHVGTMQVHFSKPTKLAPPIVIEE